MPYTTLIAADELAQHIENPEWALVDCRFSLQDSSQGQQEYEQAHIPGAVYAHLDNDLAAPVVPGVTGRHPLPDMEHFAQQLGAWGIGAGVQVVVYDSVGGAFAARLWWMLRWLGHEAAAVLDGGWPAWVGGGYPTRSGSEQRAPRSFVPRPRNELLASTEEVARIHTDPAFRLLDARSPERYRGEVEPLDPTAGHIPGAISAPFAENLGPDGRLLPAPELRARYTELLNSAPTSSAIAYCGSGVSAAHTLLALAHAGLGEGRLYVGSWSEWCTDPARPVARES
jgi:thiosulfate/3-mercaptopyruvate sulfurtransferase